MKYIYESHMGSFYCTDYRIDDTYCDICGDSDVLLGIVSTKDEAKKVIKESMFGDCYDKEYIKEFLNKAFEDGEANDNNIDKAIW